MINMHAVVIELTGLTVALVGCLAVLALCRPIWILGLFIFTLPFERIGSYSLNPTTGYPLLHPAQLVGAAMIAAFGWRWLAGRERLHRVASLPFLLAFLAAAAVSASIVRLPQVWQIYVWLIFITAVFYVVAQLAIRHNLTVIRKSLSISALVVSLFGLYQFFGNLLGLPDAVTGIRGRYGQAVLGFPRLQSTALEPLYFANYLFLPLFALLALTVIKRSQDRLSTAALVTALVAFVLTFSRGAFVSGIVGLVVLAGLMRNDLWGWTKRHYKLLLAGLVALVAGSALVIAVSIKSGANRHEISILKGYFTTRIFRTGSFTERTRDQKLALRIFKQHPIFGVGIGGFGSAYYGCHIGKCVYRPNNQALEVLAEGGLVGFAAFHAFLLAVMVYGWRAMQRATGERRAMIAGLIAATVAMIVQSQTFSGFLCCLTYTWATLGLLAGLSTAKPSADQAKADA